MYLESMQISKFKKMINLKGDSAQKSGSAHWFCNVKREMNFIFEAYLSLDLQIDEWLVI